MATLPRVILILHGTDIDAHKAVTERLVQGGLGVKAIGLGDVGKTDKEVALVVTAPQPLLESLLRKQEAIEGAVAAKMTEADGIRLLVEFVTTAKYFHGLGILVNEDLWAANTPIQQDHFKWVGGNKCVKDLIVLHDEAFEQKWLKRWEKNWILSTSDITEIQAQMGEKVGYWFAFVNFYTQALVPLAAFGFIAFILFPAYSYLYAFGLSVWSILFVVSWKREETWLADIWNASLAEKTDMERPEFIPERLDIDPTTSAVTAYYPFWKRWIVHVTCTVPLIAVFTGIVIMVSILVLTAEVFTKEVYQGPNKFIVKLVPTLIFTLFQPIIQLIYKELSVRITALENSQSISDNEASLSRKSFIITVLLTHLSLLLTGVVYIPFSDRLVPYFNPLLEKHNVRVQGLNAAEARNLLGPSSLQEKVISYSVTNQIINQFVQVLLPLALAWWSTRSINTIETTELKTKRKEEEDKIAAAEPEAAPLLMPAEKVALTADEELKFQIEKQLALPKYEMFDEYADLMNQFSLLVMFSASWPVAGVFCLANNFFDLRTHAFKICKTVRRPIPFRTNNIDPWTQIMSTFAVLGTVSTTLITLLYHSWDQETLASLQSLPRIFSDFAILVLVEHLHLFFAWVCGFVINTIWGDLKVIAHKRKQYERQMLGYVQGKYGGVVENYSGTVDSVMEKVSQVFGRKRKEE